MRSRMRLLLLLLLLSSIIKNKIHALLSEVKRKHEQVSERKVSNSKNNVLLYSNVQYLLFK